MDETMKTDTRTTALLDIDAVSYATAVGEAAAQRLADVLTDASANPWYNGGFAVSLDQGEKDVQALGAYVCNAHEEVRPEQLYRKASELSVHAFDVAAYYDAEMWLQTAYQVFALTVTEAHSAIVNAQAREHFRREKMKEFAAAPYVPAAEDTVMEQEGDAMALVHEGAADLAPVSDHQPPGQGPERQPAPASEPAPEPAPDVAPLAGAEPTPQPATEAAQDPGLETDLP